MMQAASDYHTQHGHASYLGKVETCNNTTCKALMLWQQMSHFEREEFARLTVSGNDPRIADKA